MIDFGTPKRSSISSLHCIAPMSKRSVRLALVVSVMWTSPLVSFHTSQESGAPVFLSHTTTVSRWSVMPMAATGSSICAISSASVVSTADQISLASCSTQPG